MQAPTLSVYTSRFPKETFGSSCCRTTNPITPTWIARIDQVCRIALGIFAGLLSPTAFSLSLSIGLAASLGCAFASHHNMLLFSPGDSKPVCAQGYMDFLSGVRFPPVIGSLATALFIAAHMRHDPYFYVPFCGVCLGFWAGRSAIQLIYTLSEV